MATLILAVLILLFAYPFVIYPFLLALWAKRMPAVQGGGDAAGEQPAVALVICALNEQRIIREKIENSLALRYPREKLTIVVVSDGSADRTAEIVLEYRDAGVVLLDRKVRRGKIANLNEVIPSRSEKIVVLSDANVLYHPDAIAHLVARFSDPSVGCVSGKVVLTGTTPDLDSPTIQYYSVEWALQENSSIIYAMAGADGAMYALRRELFRPCPNDTLIEDFVIPMQVIAQGKRVVLEPKALGWEKGVESLREEYRRKVRIAAGAAQGLLRGNAWPHHAPGRFWFIFMSHKLLRWMSPVVGALLLLLSLLWVREPVAQIILAGMAVMALLALGRLIAGWKHTFFSAPFYFLFAEIALGIGLLKGFTGLQTVLWPKANR
jgi:cellulose synthase/poly-beta-1,6-N-acetylglucosamine synthase-like glycosyltransferase